MARRGTANGSVRGSGRKRIEERRQWQRLPLAIPIFARGADGQGKEFLEFTTTLNISAGGALLAMRRYLTPACQVMLEIPAAPLPRVSDAPQVVRSVKAKLLRVTPSEPSYLWALRFDHRIELG